MGDMMVTIKSYFRKNGLFYGFTGTPLFDENPTTGKINEKSELIDTTAKLFGKELHKYTIDEAIKDKNVLGFHVDYINTGEFESYESLREQIVDEIHEEQPHRTKRDIERDVYELSELEVEKEARDRQLLVYQDETHIPKVVTEILDHWLDQSQNKFFNAILTVAYKHRVIAYYREFQKQLEERDDISINVVMTVSFGTDEDRGGPLEPEEIQEIFKDYAKFTGVEYTYGDRRHGEDAYYEDIVERTKSGGSGRNPRNIDLVIVADQLLTGYDSRFINTLYVDRQLKLQHLIQAYSRTNRIFGKEKEFGSIVNFMYPRITEEMVKDALVLYGSGGKSSRAIVDPYDVAVRKFVNNMKHVEEVLNDPTAWQSLQSDERAKEQFLKAYREARSQFNTVQQYYEYDWDDTSFGVTEHEWMRYEGAFRNLTRDEETEVDREDETPIFPLGETKLAGSQRIEAHFIIQLIEERATSSDGKQTVDSDGLEAIYHSIEELSNLGEHEQAELLKQFVIEEIEPGNISVGKHFDDAYEEWKYSKLQAEINDISKEWGMDEKVFERSVIAYGESESKEVPFMEEITATLDYESIENPKTENPLDHIIKLGDKLPEIVQRLNRKYRS